MNRKRIGAAVGAGVAAGLLALTISAAAGASAKQATKFKPGGTLVVAMTNGEPDDLDAHTNIVPQLAAALPKVSSNKLTVTIPLRHGIKFNDGTAFNANAVVKT